MAVLAVAQLGRAEQEEDLMKHLTQCVIGAMAVWGCWGRWGWDVELDVELEKDDGDLVDLDRI